MNRTANLPKHHVSTISIKGSDAKNIKREPYTVPGPAVADHADTIPLERIIWALALPHILAPHVMQYRIGLPKRQVWRYLARISIQFQVVVTKQVPINTNLSLLGCVISLPLSRA